MVKKLLIGFVLVLAALYVAADFGARALAGAGVARELQTSLELSSKPDVSLGGFPFIPKLVSGHFDTVTVSANGFSSGGVRFAGVDLTLHDVKTSTWRVLRGADTTIAVGGGEGSATMTAADASAALRSAGLPLSVTFHDGKIAVAASTGGSPAVPVTAVVRHGALLLRSGGLPDPIRIRLPQVIPRLHFTGVKVVGPRAAFTFTVRRATLKVA